MKTRVSLRYLVIYCWVEAFTGLRRLGGVRQPTSQKSPGSSLRRTITWSIIGIYE